jgi:hypothetical protein
VGDDPDVPICDGFIEQSHLILSRTAKMVNKVVTKNLPGNTILSHKSGGGFLETLGQPLALIPGATRVPTQCQWRARNLELLFHAAPATA